MQRNIYLKLLFTIPCMMMICGIGWAQTQTADYYNVNAGNGKGLRLWNGSQNYKIHMGNSSVYKYGPVTGYSIKTNMSNTAGRGWTWGVVNVAPVAALNTQGNFQIKGWMKNMSRTYYFGDVQRLVGNNASALYWNSNHSTITQLIMRDKESTTYGRVYGSGNGANFGLLDGDGNWSYKAAKDNYTAFLIDNSEKMRIQSNGNVGVGNNNPAYKLHVAGDVYANGGWVRVSGNSGLYFQSHGGGFRMVDNTWIRTYGNKSFYHNTGIMRTDGTFQVGGNGDRFVVRTDGNVGIGTTNPTYKLSVNGNIRAKEVKVETGWSDYVFYDDYQLPTLEEEAQHIEAEGHLLGFESEADMGGEVSLGEVTRLQQAKIEEMMLQYYYTIQVGQSLKTQKMTLMK